MQFFPVIDGHFWVERDGEIIDPYFKQYDYIKCVNGLDGDRIYLPASSIVQQVLIRKFQSVCDNDTAIMMMKTHNYKITFGICYMNALLEISRNGGTLVFGSMGWKRSDKLKGRIVDPIHWEFGGEGWKVSQFIK